MPRPKKNQPVPTPVIEPQTIDIAREDIVIGLLMRMHGKSIDETANYLKVPVSQIENISEFKTPRNCVLKILAENLKTLDDPGLTALDVRPRQMLIDYLIDEHKNLKQSSFITLKNSIETLSNQLEVLTTKTESLKDDEIGSRTHTNIVKEIRATVTTLAKLQDDLRRIDAIMIRESVVQSNISLKVLQAGFDDDDFDDDGLSGGGVPLKPSPSTR